jgi:DNA-binding NarL/FixJ family response regulator
MNNAAETETIRVVVVEDDPAIREGLRLLIDGTAGYRCAATFGAVEEALRGPAPEAPDVILLDINLPGMPGSEGVAFLKERFPRCQVVMLTVYSEEDKIFESICNGACGYLLKRVPPALLLEGIAEAHRGGAPMSPQIARKVVTLFQKVRPRLQVEHDLTPQEVRLLRFLSEGHTYESAGSQLNVSVNTVRNYVRSVYDKLHVHSKSEAVATALKSGILD